MALAHLGPDRENRLGAALDMVLVTHLVELRDNRFEESRDQLLTLLRGLLQFRQNVLIVIGFEIAERDILQLALDGIKTQLVSNLSVDIQALPTLFVMFRGGENRQRAHHFEAVGQLDQNHTRIGRIRHDQVAEIVGLLLSDFGFDVRDIRQRACDINHVIAKL